MMRNIFSYHSEDSLDTILEQIENWISDSEFKSLVTAFGGKEINIGKSLSLKDGVKKLVEFSDIWDYRGRLSQKDSDNAEKARWMIADTELSEKQCQQVKLTAEKLGLVGCAVPSHKKYDYILVLGGARMSCLYRMKYARQVCDGYGIEAKNIIGLAGMRGVMESERGATDTYARSAKTEFDLMRAAVQSVYGNLPLVSEQGEDFENPNYSWAMERYEDTIPVMLLAAPSVEPERRRANTSDTFDFFVKQLQVSGKSNILLITSQIYVPYQQLEAIRILGIPYEHALETVGFPNEWSASLHGVQKPENYLQEMRSVLQSMERLLEVYGT